MLTPLLLTGSNQIFTADKERRKGKGRDIKREKQAGREKRKGEKIFGVANDLQ